MPLSISCTRDVSLIKPSRMAQSMRHFSPRAFLHSRTHAPRDGRRGEGSIMRSLVYGVICTAVVMLSVITRRRVIAMRERRGQAGSMKISLSFLSLFARAFPPFARGALQRQEAEKALSLSLSLSAISMISFNNENDEVTRVSLFPHLPSAPAAMKLPGRREYTEFYVTSRFEWSKFEHLVPSGADEWSDCLLGAIALSANEITRRAY